MKSFFKTFFASTLGVLFASFILTMVSVFALIGMAASTETTYEVKKNTVFKLTLGGTINDKDQSTPFDALLGSSEGMTEGDIVASIRKAKENDNVKGIYLKTDVLSASFSNLLPIRKALIDFKESGKFVIAYGEVFQNGSYMVASVADKVIFNPEGIFLFDGLGAIAEFKKNQYELLGIKYEVFKVGTFKSAVEYYTEEKMSDANRLQTESYMGDVWKHILNNVSESRNIPVDRLNELVDKGLLFADAKDLVEYGLIDTLMFETDIEDYLKDFVEVDDKKDIKYASLKNMKSAVGKKEKVHKDKIAILYAEGQIVNDFYPSSPFLGSGSMINPKTYATELKKLQDDDEVKAVVFRVSSPGGSASASEQILHALVELNKVKPVIVSMGAVAASGGYYISSGATAIVAEPTTITGSIGIFGLIPNGEELAKKMGLSFDEVATNKFSNFGGASIGIPFLVNANSRGLNEAEKQLMQLNIEKGYDQFIGRCAEGRNMTKEEIDKIGQGRVWTGAQAKEIGLVDQLGGLQDAIELAAEKAELEDYSTLKYPKEKDFFTQLMEEMLEGVEVKMIRTFMGERYNQKMYRETLQNIEFRQAIMLEPAVIQ